MHLLWAVFDARFEPLLWFALGVCGAIGALAVVNPRRALEVFVREAGWAESAKNAAGVPTAGAGFYSLVLCRIIGVALLGAVAAVAWFVAQQ